jgi:hypothetical protein
LRTAEAATRDAAATASPGDAGVGGGDGNGVVGDTAESAAPALVPMVDKPPTESGVAVRGLNSQLPTDRPRLPLKEKQWTRAVASPQRLVQSTLYRQNSERRHLERTLGRTDNLKVVDLSLSLLFSFFLFFCLLLDLFHMSEICVSVAT